MCSMLKQSLLLHTKFFGNMYTNKYYSIAIIYTDKGELYETEVIKK